MSASVGEVVYTAEKKLEDVITPDLVGILPIVEQDQDSYSHFKDGRIETQLEISCIKSTLFNSSTVFKNFFLNFF